MGKGKSKTLIIAAFIVGALFLVVGLVFTKMSGGEEQQVATQQQVQEPIQQPVEQQEPEQQVEEQQVTDQQFADQSMQQSTDQMVNQQQVAQNQQVNNPYAQGVQQPVSGSPASNIDAQQNVQNQQNATTGVVQQPNNVGVTNQVQTNGQVQTTTGTVANNTQSGKQVEVINRNDLGASTATKTVEMSLADKRLYKTSALDADLGLSQTAYVAVITDGALSLPIFITASTFNALNIGDKLKVTYSVFNVNGENIYDVYKVEK